MDNTFLTYARMNRRRLTTGPIGQSPAMRMSVRLKLPRETGSVPAVRRLLRCALAMLHVDTAYGADLEIALTEACANVVRHARGAEKFEVRLDVAEDRCAIDVLDDGAGFDLAAVDASPGPASERGRGLFLIKALSENVRMHSSPRSGSLIHFEKSFA
jgi:serine/threonine-protein kinase RsbW